MIFKLEVSCDNAAFDPDLGSEVARILRDTADRFDGWDAFACASTSDPYFLRDINGNKVGTARFVKEEDDA